MPQTAGTIPAEWAELPSLEYLYVKPGNPKLCGPLPEGMNFKVHACACVRVHMAGVRLGLRLLLVCWMAALAWVHSLLQPCRICSRGNLEGCACHVRSKAGQVLPSFPTAALPVQLVTAPCLPHALASSLVAQLCDSSGSSECSRPAVLDGPDCPPWVPPNSSTAPPPRASMDL